MAPFPSYISTLFSRTRTSTSISAPIIKRSDALSPLQAGSYFATRDVAREQTAPYDPGSGSVDPHHIDNRAFFALFALVGVFLVLGGIWFFFWAKNGGFKFRKGDWDEYKSTVLRRKGPNGTTLSGATRTTRLGGGSVVAGGGQDMDEKLFKKGVQPGKKKKGPRGNKNNHDSDMRAYRQEKPARVGGLNRESDGIFNHDFAYSDTGYSDDVSSQGQHIPINTPRAKPEPKRTNPDTKKATEPMTPSPKKKTTTNNFYSQTPGSNNSTDSHRPLRPHAQAFSRDSTPTRSRQSSPSKNHHHPHHSRASVPGSFYTDPLDFESRYSATNSDAGVTEDSRGTKAYFHPIPGLGSDSGRVGAGGGGGGFRRGRGRRDSLSDSEGETMAS